MKKLFFVMAAVAALLTSCSKDDTFGGPTRGKVTFEVSTPELATRYGDGSKATKLYYAVYDMVENTTDGVKVHESTTTLTNGAADVLIDLVEGRKYTAIFWADAGNDSPYTFDAATKTVSYTNVNDLTANNENYDAFFAFVPEAAIKVGQTVDVDLKRPFAQLNIATNDTVKAMDLQVVVENTAVTVAGVYTSFNLANGEVQGQPATVTFASAEKAEGTITTSTGVKDDTYDMLAMNYVLVKSDNNPLVDVTLNFTDKVGNTEENYVRQYNDVTVKRNHRTNIVGSILTDETIFDVDIEEGFLTPDNDVDGDNSETLVVSTADEIIDAFANLNDDDPSNDPGTIVLGNDIDLNELTSIIIYDNSAALSTTTRAGETSYGLLIPAGKTLTLDLNGFIISQEKAQTTAYNMIQNQGTLTIMDSSANGGGKISYKDTGNGGEYVSNAIQNSGTLTIEAGTIENNSVANVATNGYPHPIDNSGKLIINGGTIKNNANYSSMRIWCTTDDDTEVTINGGTFYGSIDFQTVNKSANKGTLTINGGQFNADEHCGAAVRLLGFGIDVDEMNGYINGGEFNGKIMLRNYINGEFNSQVFHISGGTFSDASVFNFLADGAEIDLGADIKATDVITLDKSVKVNGNDHSINSSASRVFRVIAGGIDVEFNNFNINATSTVKGNGSNPDSIRGISIDSGIKNVALTLNDCDVKFTDDEIGKDWAYAVNLTSGGSDNTITINGGKYEGANVINIHSPKTTVNIDGATLTSLYPDHTSYYGACIMVVQSSGAKDCNVTIKNSTFNGNNAIALNIVNSENTVVEENNTNNCSTNIVYGESTEFTTFEKAIETSQAISLVGNMTLSKSITIPTDKNIILDLNGNVLSGVNNAGQGYLFMVNNGASLTIKDSSDDQSGKITYAQGTSNTGWAIDLEGELNLESGTIELTGDNWSIGYAVDVRPNAWGTAYTSPTTFNMKGGKLVSSDGAVRVASSSSESYSDVSANFNMTGGEIEAAYDGIFFQQSNAAYDNLNLNISAGTINANMYPVRIYGPEATSKVGDSSLKISGGTFKKVVNTEKAQLVEGLLYIAGGVAADTLYYTDIEVTGGSFDDGEALPAYSMDAKAPATSNVE